MKPTFIAICLLLSSLGFSAYAQKAAPSETQTIQLKEVFTSLSVDNDIQVVLTENTAGEMLVEGDVKSLDIQLVDGHLQLSKKQPAKLSPLKVYVPSVYLSKVYMNGNGSLSSASVLSNNRIRIILGGEARIAVRSIGHVILETENGIQFVKSR
jgi:hypothetical protein